ncbi:MAG: ferrous iron transporter B [Candidatus Obscuribacterales bacterium]|nr:ferrous iron transporter B [Candidatus Obscuribacterales bacterium]
MVSTATSSQPTGQQQSEKGKQIVLAGNPNVGKSALFTALTGTHAEVSNFPGTTIDISHGSLGADPIADTPGIYGVSSFNDEERIARKMILAADQVINVVSALSLDRDLFLTLQLIDMGKPLLLVVNQWDEAEERSMRIDLPRLSEILGVPVVPTVAVKKQGIKELLLQVPDSKVGNASKLLLNCIESNLKAGIPQNYAVLIAEDDEDSAREQGVETGHQRSIIYRERRQRVNEIVQEVVKQTERKKQLSLMLGKLLLNPLYGGIISAFVCYLIFYQLLGVFVAGTVVEFTEKKFMRVYCEPGMRQLVALALPATIKAGERSFDFPAGTLADQKQAAELQIASQEFRPDEIKYDFWSHKNLPAAIANILAGEYGILTLTVTYLIGLLFPLVLAFYFGLSLLEDSGYLPRLAVLVDRILNRIGLTGRAIIPLILGLGCVTMATVTTRLLSSTREKIIATALLGIAIPCSAQLGIVSGTLAKCGGALPWLVYGGVVASMLVGTGLLLNKIMPGKSTGLMIDLPPMRLPRAGNVLRKTWSKTYNFMLESIPMFCIAGLFVSIGQMTGLLDWLIKALSPITVGLLRLPADPRIPTTFILGIVRRDFAAFGLTDVNLSAAQAVVAMVVITLFVPCIATVGVMIKERGLKMALSIWVGSWLFAIVVGTALAQLLPPLFQIKI